ncbi:hypothetical protein Hanom_Chr17g01550521 [Helianthus anomalus]
MNVCVRPRSSVSQSLMATKTMIIVAKTNQNLVYRQTLHGLSSFFSDLVCLNEYGIRPDSLEARSTIDINLIFAMQSSCTRPTPRWKATSTLKG